MNFASSPGDTPARIGFGTPFTKLKSVRSTVTVPSAGSVTALSLTSMYAFCVGFRVVPALRMSG